MPLPHPLPDDPRKWEGWRLYDSPNYYERLCLVLEDNPSDSLVEDHCRQLIVWWQKKLPLKNQPANPIAQLLWAGMDAAPGKITQARSELLKPEVRARLDAEIRQRRREAGLQEFNRFLEFALGDQRLTKDGEATLRKIGTDNGLSNGDMDAAIDAGLRRSSAKRVEDEPPPPSPEPEATPQKKPETRRVRSTNRVNRGNVDEEFLRMLRLSGLEADSMTDDQRDAFVNVGENLGLDPGHAEDLVDQYLDEMEGRDAPAPKPAGGVKPATGVKAAPQPYRPSGSRPAGSAPLPEPPAQRGVVNPATSAVPLSSMTPAEERARYRNFSSPALGAQMLLVPSGSFIMGSSGAGAAANEQPPTRVNLSRYFIARHLVTNAQYELFDPSHKTKRLANAGDNHPVVYVSSLEAIKFCQWLAIRERKRYRLPTEAEWEYAARGPEGRTYPWGEATGRADLANFADANTNFPWSDRTLNDGFAETSPVGTFPRGVSHCGVEDLGGNVWEWCSDYYEPYKASERTNPTGPKAGAQRVLRGGSWKTRFTSMRSSARSFNAPNFASNDVGFRTVCECE